LKFYSILFVQPDCDAETPEFERSLLPTDTSDSDVPSGYYPSCRCAEHLSRIADLEGRLSLLKQQAKTAMDQAGRSLGLMKQVCSLESQVSDLMAKTAMDQAGRSLGLMKRVPSLESQVSDLMAKIVHLEECDAFLVGIIESACEQLQCKFLEAPECICVFCDFICFNLLFFRYLLEPY
jgi:hypothetical protein